MTGNRPRTGRGGGSVDQEGVHRGTDALQSTSTAAADKPYNAWRYRLKGHQGIRILVRRQPATADEIAAELRARFRDEPVLLTPIGGAE